MRYSALAILIIFFFSGCTGKIQYGNSATPIIRDVSPHYPSVSNAKEGYVVLRYDINAHGLTENIVVIEAVPKRIFNRVSINAVSQWKYERYIINGEAQVQKNISVRLDFLLE